MSGETNAGAPGHPVRMPELWRGAANAWQCDEMGHMNVRFYLAHAADGLAGLACELGMAHAFAPDAPSTLIVREHHIRYLREAHAGAPLHIEGGLITLGETSAQVLLIMRHSRSGEPAASFVVEVEHASTDGRPFPWSSRTLKAAPALMCKAPDIAGPRGVDGGSVARSEASLAAARALGLRATGEQVVRPDECDLFGRLRPEAVMGRFSDAAAQLFGGIPRPGSEDGGPRLGGALLEMRILHLRAARAGQRLLLRSTLTDVDPRFNRLSHWLLDAETGEAVASARGLAAAIDLDARRIAERSPAHLEALRAEVIPDTPW